MQRPELKLADSIWRYIQSLAMSLWLGGLTFYGLVVVPLGNEVHGTIEQGFVTQRVTVWLNLSAVAGLILFLRNVIRNRGWLRITSWLLMAVCQTVLFLLHEYLDRMLDVSTHEILGARQFHFWHEAYLTITGVQWTAGLIHFWCILNLPSSVRLPDSGRLPPDRRRMLIVDTENKPAALSRIVENFSDNAGRNALCRS